MIYECCRCHEFKDEKEFVSYKHRPRGYTYRCLTCESARKRAFYHANKESQRARFQRWRSANPEKYRESSARSNRKQYYSRTEEQKVAARKYFRELSQRKRETDANFRIRDVLSSRLTVALRLHGGTKARKTMELLGCSLEFFKEYLEARFQPGMTWETYGRSGWTIDHRIPCAEFDLRDPIQQKQCFHYSNLQPMWQAENFSKRHKMPATHQAELI